MTHGLAQSAAAALLLALAVHAPLVAQDSARVALDTAGASPHRLTLSLAVGRSKAQSPELVADLLRGTVSARIDVGYAFPRGLEAAVSYERAGFEQRQGGGVTSTTHALSLTGKVLAAAELPVRPFVEFGPSVVVLTDDAGESGEDGSSIQVGAVLGAGVRLPLTGRLGATASASLLFADGAELPPMYIFTGLRAGLLLGL